MKFVFLSKDQSVLCTHPKVKKCWSVSKPTDISNCVVLIMENGDRKRFCDSDTTMKNQIKQANDYLKTI